MIFSEKLFVPVELLTVKEQFLHLWKSHLGAVQQEELTIEVTSENKITTSKELCKVTGEAMSRVRRSVPGTVL